MAQGNKSRVIIWTIVGILVIIAAVMLIKKPKGVSGPPVIPERFQAQMENRLGKLEGKVAKARAEFPGAPAEQWQKITDEIAKTRQLMGEMAGLTEQKDLKAKLVDVQKAYNEAKRTLKEITGKEEKDEGDTGQ
jgi:uncharacterized coiled-coil protein SlyX